MTNQYSTKRLYYTDPSLRRFTARVSDIRELARRDGRQVWQVALDRSAFYPTSGGQPHDTGLLRASSRMGAVLEALVEDVQVEDVQVEDVQVEDVQVRDVEKQEAGTAAINAHTQGRSHGQGLVWHTTAKPLPIGTSVEGEIDWPRRFDHMQQHSGQHLLSAVFATLLQAPTVSFHLGQETSTIDLKITGANTALETAGLAAVEQRANEIIAEDLAMPVRFVSREEAEALLAEGRLRKLPPRSGEIRLVEIPGWDLNACGGTHVARTGQIGSLLLRGAERVKQGLRVAFVCGLRAVTQARADFDALARTAALLSVGGAEVPVAVERLQAAYRTGQKDLQKAREELAEYHATRLAVEDAIRGGLRDVRRSFATRDAAYVKMLASKLVASVPQTSALFISRQQEPATVIFARSQDLEFPYGEWMRLELARLGLRGGGSPDMAQCQVPSAQAEAVVRSLGAAVRASFGLGMTGHGSLHESPTR